MESAGKSVVDSLEIALHLVDMLPSIPLQLTFNTVTARAAQVHTQGPYLRNAPLSINQGAMTVLGEEILQGACGAWKIRVMQATWHVTAMDTGLVKVMTIGSEGGDGSNHPGTSLSLALHAHLHSHGSAHHWIWNTT